MNNSGTHSCRSCGYTKLEQVLSLGNTPLANALLRADQVDEPEEMYPLELVFCPSCCLVQITETVSPEILFRNYHYLSSFSDTMLQHANGLVNELIRKRSLGPTSLVMEIASNDGYLLQYYQRSGIEVLGIEPATNIAEIAENAGIPTICDFFNTALAERLLSEGRRADVIHANNVLAHVEDVNGLVRGIGLLLKDDGVAVVEVPYVKDMIDQSEFDTIYHEHLSYFSLTSLNRIFRRQGLKIVDVERLPIHGGTLRVYSAKENGALETQKSVDDMLKAESNWGVDKPGFYLEFVKKVERLRGELVELLHSLKSQDKRIAVYGASAKGSTLLNYFGIGKDTLDYVVDRSTVKQGLYTPGTHLQIHPTEKLLQDMPDYVLLLTWNFADEILEQQLEYRQRGGHFILPIPSVKVI